jgi:hypothetical protein
MRLQSGFGNRGGAALILLLIFLVSLQILPGQTPNSSGNTLGVSATSSQNQETAKAPAEPPNYDESKIQKYALPDPLVLLSGERVITADAWYKFRRPELIRLFETYVYGRTPTYKPAMKCQQFEESDNALGGTAIRKQVTCFFAGTAEGPKMDILIYLPAAARRPVPLFLGLNFTGNQSVNADPGIKLADVWNRETKTRQKAAESTRGSWAREWQVETVIAHGYGIASIYYGDIDPDFPGGMAAGVRPLFFSPYQVSPEPDDWGSIGAWAWGLSRALDFLETEKAVDANRVALVGQSRLGKTVLWAGALDTRFAMVIANCSGRSGASLARRNFGETVEHMVVNFPHQFAINYQTYGENVNKLPVDTHELLALIAPRPLLLGTATLDRWSDPKGEFLAANAAEPVFKLLGVEGLGTTQMPGPEEPILHRVGFVYHTGEHQITPYSWDVFLKFADKYLTPQR